MPPILGPVIGAVGSAAASAVGGSIVLQAVVGLATTGAQLLVEQLFAPKQQRPKATKTLGQVPELGNRFVVLGQVRVSGHITFFDATDGTSGATTNNLYTIFVHSYSKTDAFDTAVDPAAYLDGELVTVDGSGWVQTPAKWLDLVQLRPKYGGPAQAALSQITGQFSHLDSNFRGREITYTMVRQKPVGSAKLDKTYPDGRLNLQVQLKGALLPNPFQPDAAWSYSNNAARAVLWMLLDDDLGYGIPKREIDWGSFVKHTRLCSETVTTSAGSEDRYNTNGIVDAGRPRIDILRDLLTNCDAELRMNADGLIEIVPWFKPHTYNLTDDHALLYTLSRGIPEQQRYNSCVGIYVDPNNDWQETSTPERNFPLTRNEARNTYRLPLPFCTSATQAQRLVKRWLYRVNPVAQGSITTDLATLHLYPGDYMGLRTSEDLLNGGKVRINTREIQEDGATLIMDVIAVDSEYNRWNHNTDEQSVSTPSTMNDNADVVDAPTISGVSVVSDVVRGAEYPELEIDHSTEDADLLVESEWKVSGGDYQGLRRRAADVGTIRTGPVPDNSTLDVRIRFVNRNGIAATDWTENTGTDVLLDSTNPPTDPSSLSTSAATATSLDFTCTSPSSTNYWRTEIRYGVDGVVTWATGTHWGYILHWQKSTADTITISGLSGSTTYRIYAQSQQTSGDGSGSPPSATGTTS